MDAQALRAVEGRPIKMEQSIEAVKDYVLGE
jgi:hypothetical protein